MGGPDGLPRNRWKANKLRSKLTHDLMRDLAAHTHAAGRAHWYADHSLASFGATGLVFPYGRALLAGDADAFVAQVWTWPVKLVLNGQGEACSAGAGHGDCQFFEAATMLFSHWIELSRDTGVPVYLLADPVDDDASQTMPEYREWWREIVVAGMSFPEAGRFEVMPWPERIFAADGIAGGAPEDYRQELLAVFEAQRQIGDAPDFWSGAPDSRIGVVAGDTMIWQDPDVFPVAPTALALQLVRKGVPAAVVPAERLTDPAYRARFTTLVVSYDGWKPETAEQNQALADFALGGGVLLVLSRGDELDAIGEWWGASPLADLLSRAGFQASISGQKEPGTGTVTLAPALDTPLAGAAGTINVPRAPITEFTAWSKTGAARTFLATGPDARVLYTAGDAPVILDQITGQGAVVLAGVSARDLMWDANGATVAFALARYAGEAWGHRPVRERGYAWTRRGDWHLVSSRTASPALTGRFIDWLDPSLPLLTNPAPPANRVRIYRQVDALTMGSTPRILASNQRLANVSEGATSTSFRARGPSETTAVVRLARNGRTLGGASAGVTVTLEGETVKLSFAGAPDGRDVTLGWN